MSAATPQAVTYTELDDNELVQRCLKKDERAWGTLLKRYAGLIYSIPLKQGLGRDMAEEVFQSVAMTLVERLHLLLDPECLPKWLMVTTARRCRLLLQRQRRQLEPPTAIASPVSEDAQESLERAEIKLHLDQALEQLGDRDRDVLLDLFDRELPYAEVARRHGLAIGSLGSLRARALTRLRKILEKERYRMSVLADDKGGAGRGRLKKKPRGDRHLNDSALAELAARERSPEGRESLHLAGCEACRDRIAATQAILDGLRYRSQGPGEQALRRAGSLLKRARAASELPAELVSHWRPGSTTAAPAGLRSASPATRQWLFRAASMEIDLQAFAEGPEARHLLGQVLGPDGAVAGLPVHIRHNGPAHMCVTDDHGEFSCGPVRGEAVRLVVESEEQLHSLELGALPFEAGPDDED